MLRMDVNLIVGVCYSLRFLYIWRRDNWKENLEEMMCVKFELKKGLKGVKEIQVVTKLRQMKRLLDRSLNLVRPE